MSGLWNELVQNSGSPLGSLILQIFVILVVARLFGLAMRRLGQPQVVGEILAGVCLGPSLLGTALPDIHHYVFPEGSIQRLFFISQVGILLFMFMVGLEFDFELLRRRAKSAFVISQASIVLPFALGIMLAFVLFAEEGANTGGFLPFALFMGIAMSITAFPVLARMLREHELTRTRIGTIAITCAAVDDVTAWCLLALVVGVAKSGSAAAAIGPIALSVVYVLLMFYVVRPALRGMLRDAERLTTGRLAFLFLCMLASALVTESIGIHALFGAFLFGTIIPASQALKERLAERLRDVTTIVLLPLFFTLTGLRTQIGLLDDASSWLICGLILAVAVLGKFGGAAVAARLTGHPWRASLLIGALMNTRGLIELVVLNIGYDLDILSPRIFTMMVVMAIATTMMTGPLVRLLEPLGAGAERPASPSGRPLS